MKKITALIFVLVATVSVYAQEINQTKIRIEVKPIDPKKGYSFELMKSGNEVKIYYKRVDSIAKFSFADKDQATLKRLMGKNDLYFDSLTQDSLAYFQHKVDSIRTINTSYKTDSATIYKSSHPAYWKYIETLLQIPNSTLEAKRTENPSIDQTFSFFTFVQNNQERQLFIDSLDPTNYPLLTKLINDTIEVMKAFKQIKDIKH